MISKSDLQIAVVAMDQYTSAIETLARLIAEWNVATQTAGAAVLGAIRPFVGSDAWGRLDRQPRPRGHAPHRRKHPVIRRRRP